MSSLRILSIAASGVLAASTIGTARAEIRFGDQTPLFQVGAGGYDVFHNYTAGVFRGEYRFGSILWLLTPLAGLEVTTDGDVYGYGGLGIDIDFGDWVLTPNAAVGGWSHGDGKQLGSVIEFRTGAELDYRLDNEARLGFSFHHISNAGIGQHNPGEEEALLVYSIPFDF